MVWSVSERESWTERSKEAETIIMSINAICVSVTVGNCEHMWLVYRRI